MDDQRRVELTGEDEHVPLLSSDASQVSESRLFPQQRRGLPEWMQLAISIIVLLLLWQGAVRIFDVDAFILPAPTEIVTFLLAFTSNGLLWKHLWATSYEIVLGFLVGAAAGIVTGALVAEFKPIERLIYPYLVAFQSLPKVAIAPIMVIWLGFGIVSKVIMAALVAYFPIVVNTANGFASLDTDQINLLKSFGASRSQVFRYLKVPNALPFTFAGLEIGIVLSVLGAVVAEFVGASEGLGYLVLRNSAQLRMANVFGILLILSMLGIVLHALVVFMRRKIVFWDTQGKGEFTGV